MLHTISALWCVLLFCLSACSQTTARTLQVGAGTTSATLLTASEVAAQVQVIERPGDLLYRAPTLRVAREVNVQRSGPVAGANLGSTTLGQSGFLLGIRRRDTDVLRHFAAYNSDFIEGTNRFVSVKSADGQALEFSSMTAAQNFCPGSCNLTFETLMIAVPDALLRNVTDAGLTFTITLDNGHEFPITAPAAYVRGYLQAVGEVAP